MEKSDSRCKTASVILVFAICLAAGLRLWQLDRAALWEDDYFNLGRGLMALADMFHAQKFAGPTSTFHDYQPPLYYALQHLALSVSQTSLAARLVSFLAGMLALAGLYKAGGSLFGRRAGLFALVLAGLSLFHIDASRAIKTYSVYLCASAWALHFLYEAAVRARTRLWIAYVPCAAAMVYSSFLGVPGLAAQLLFAGGVLSMEAWRREPGWKNRAGWFGAAALAVLLVCLPWVEAVVFIRDMFHNPGVDPLASMTWTKTRELAEGFLGHVFAVSPWVWAGLPLLTLAGAAGAVAGGRSKGLVLVLLWAALPALAVLTSRTEMNSVLSTRHFYNVFGMLMLLGGAGADAASKLLTGRPVRAEGGAAAALAGALVCVAASVQGLSRLPEYYARSISFDREVAYNLFHSRGLGDALDVQGWKRATKRFAMDWHLPGLFGSSGDMRAPGYRRMLVLEHSLEKGEPEPVPGAAVSEGFTYGPFGARLSAVGMANRSPVPVSPGKEGRFRYSDDYSGYEPHRDAWALRNASTDTRLGVLLPSAWSEPGSATYRFAIPEGVKPLRVEAAVKAVLYKRHPASPSKASVEVWAGPSPERLKRAGTVTLADFAGPASGCEALEEIPIYGACSRAGFRWDVTALAGGGGDIYVRLDINPGREEGYLFVDAFGLEIDTPPGAIDPGWAFTRELDNLLANNNVRPWKPGAAALDGLFAFAAFDGLAKPGSPLGTPEELAAFRAAHPGVEPVHVLRDASGRPAAYFYDPPLALSEREPSVQALLEKPFTVRGLVLSGRMNAPSLLVEGRRVDIPVAAPRGSVLMLNPGGRGKLVWSPDFSRDAFASLDFSSSDNLRPAPDADNDGGLTCREERPCHFIARFVSALPVSRVRLEWYPRVVADQAGKNVVRLSYSTDEGKTFAPLEEFKGGGTGKWTRMFGKHAATLDFSKPVNHFMLKAELSGEAAQLWSHRRPVDRMWLEADLDARTVSPFDLPGGGFPLALAAPGGNGVTLRLLDRPIPLFDSIKDWR